MSKTDTPTAPAGSEPRVRPHPLRHALDVVGVQNLSLIVALIVLCAAIGSQNSHFFLVSNIKTIGTTVAIVGILAVVQTTVMLLGGLDISVGSAAGLTSVASAMVFTSSASAGLGILVGLVVGIGVGLLNGLVIVYGRVNAVIATLATYAALRGLANLISDGRAQGYTGTDSTFVFLARGSIIGIPILVWVLIIVAALVHLMLRYTDIGRNIYATGGNPTAARLAGINLNRYVVGCYILAGFVAGIAGILLTARTGSGQPTSGSQGLELQSITAAALGGVALQGGKGGISGTILAVLLLGVLQNGLTILNVNSFWQDIAQGALLIVAVVIQQRRKGPRAYGLPG
ncbi:sugar ABC transporter permease [Streptomyces sp. 150FB]|uniref:ABC transporter permease n=1 Tax=Streptomyces sp. 150FB TaxID=1576605 RepID=UPI0005896A6A|nr:ABC transporter permease [Streptomyces sp. 150FB]KIF78419.1 sugar ABC transporter permease [Streptomyces sp. 150FB]